MATPDNLIDQFGRFISSLIPDPDDSDKYIKTNEYSVVENAPRLQACPNGRSMKFAVTEDHRIYDIVRREVLDIPGLDGLSIDRMIAIRIFLTNDGNCYYINGFSKTGYSISEYYQLNGIISIFGGNDILTKSGRWLHSVTHEEMRIVQNSPVPCERLPTIDEVLIIRDYYIVSTIGLFWCNTQHEGTVNRLTSGPGVIDVISYNSPEVNVTSVHAMLEDGRVYTHCYNSNVIPIAYELPLNGEPSEHWKLNEVFNKLNEECKWVKMMMFGCHIVIHNKMGQVFSIGRAQGEETMTSLTQLYIPMDCFIVIESGRRVKSSR